MIKNAKIYALIGLLCLVQACGSKADKVSEKEEALAVEAKTIRMSTIAQRRAQIKKDSTLIAEKRIRTLNDVVAKTPFYTDLKGNVIYHKAEVDPSFIGGDKAMMKYLRNNIVYPEQAEKDQVEGAVFVDFVISLDGSVSNVEATNATSEDVDQVFRNEAVRVVSSMPKWTPGLQNNKPVNVKYSIPVTFQIL